MSRFLLGTCLLFACATTPTAPVTTPSPVPKEASKQGNEDDAPSVAIDLTEVTFRIEADGTLTRTTREVYRLRSAEPGEAWTNVWAFWRPWGDEAPTIDATVVAPDGTASKLDQKTVSDQADKTDDGMLTDSKLRIAPLPGLTLGSVVDRTTTVRRKPLFVKGTSIDLSFAPHAPEKKRVFVVDVPAGAPLHIEAFDVELTPKRTEANGRVVLRYEQGPSSPQQRGEPGTIQFEQPRSQAKLRPTHLLLASGSRAAGGCAR